MTVSRLPIPDLDPTIEGARLIAWLAADGAPTEITDRLQRAIDDLAIERDAVEERIEELEEELGAAEKKVTRLERLVEAVREALLDLDIDEDDEPSEIDVLLARADDIIRDALSDDED